MTTTTETTIAQALYAFAHATMKDTIARVEAYNDDLADDLRTALSELDSAAGGLTVDVQDAAHDEAIAIVTGALDEIANLRTLTR